MRDYGGDRLDYYAGKWYNKGVIIKSFVAVGKE